jgi:hypothetical protein
MVYEKDTFSRNNLFGNLFKRLAPVRGAVGTNNYFFLKYLLVVAYHRIVGYKTYVYLHLN